MAKTLAALAVLVGMTAGSRADLVISIEPGSLEVAPGSAGNFFDVVLSYEGADLGPVDLTLFNVNLYVPVDAGIEFTDASESTADPYLFSGLGSGLVTNTFDDTASRYVNINDLVLAPGTSRSVVSGDRYGLARVFFSVADGVTWASIPLRIEVSTSELLDARGPDLGEPLPFTARDAELTNSSPAVVPEPSSLVQIGWAMPAAVGLARRRRRRAARAGRVCSRYRPRVLSCGVHVC